MKGCPLNFGFFSLSICDEKMSILFWFHFASRSKAIVFGFVMKRCPFYFGFILPPKVKL